MALSMKFENGDDGNFVCPGPLRCFACGGKPPYFWSTTKGVLDKTAGLVVTLRPPTNNNPNVAGEAWGIQSNTTLGGACIKDSGFKRTYGCNDQVITVCSTPGFEICNNTSNVAVCTQFGNLCTHLPFFGGACLGCLLATQQFVCDIRTQSMINQGCLPCGAAMIGAVVTVEDSAGTAVSRAIQVRGA